MSFPPSLGITSAFIIDLNSSLDFQESPSLLPSPFSRSKMNGYSRIRKISTTRSKSVDFADLSFPNHTPRSKSSNFKSPSHRSKPVHTTKRSPSMHDPIPELEQEDSEGEVFGIILSRKYPISSANSHKEIVEQQSSSFQTVVRKSISFKRSASVSEGYSRIHHQCDSVVAEDFDQNAAETTSQKTYMKKKGKFLKACKRLFGF